MPQILQLLADELLVEILGNLPPSDIINSCRTVCQRLHHCSQARGTWLKVLAQCDYALSHINAPSMSTHDLERVLFRAELVKGVWTGQRPARAGELRPYLGVKYDFCSDAYAGMMEQSAVFNSPRDQARWSWYALDRLGRVEPEAVFVFTPELGAFQKIHTWTGAIMADTQVFYAIYTQTDTLTEEDCHYLKVVSVSVLPTGRFEVKQEISHPLKSQSLFGALTSQDPHYSLGRQACVGYGYVGVFPTLAAPHEPIRLFHIKTGQAIICPWHEQAGDRRSWVNHMHFELTPWHFIQLRRDCGVLEIFALPKSAESRVADGPDLLASRMRRVALPYFPATPFLFPRTPTSYVICLHGLFRPEEEYVHLLALDLSSAVTIVKTFKHKPFSKLYVNSMHFAYTPPSSTSALAAAVALRNSEHVVLGVWLDLDGTSTNESSNTNINTQDLEVVDIYDTGKVLDIGVLDVDPSTGRIIVVTNDDPEYTTSGYALLRDYTRL